MTQRRVRQIMDVWYGDGPLGYCGDEDYGEMASWYVLSAMGFYTVAVKAPDVSAQNKYIQSATLNGRPLDRPWFTHEELQQGGTLFLQMGPRPNRNWGANPEKMPFTDHDAPKN